MAEATPPGGMSRDGVIEELDVEALDERPLDRLARIAAGLLGVPAVTMSIVTGDRQILLGVCGLPLSGPIMQGSANPCREVVESGRAVVIVDLEAEGPGRSCEAIHGLGLRAYAGVPILSKEGMALGTVAALDRVRRRWAATDLDGLRDIAAQAERELETRRSIAARDRAERHFRRLFETSPAGVYIVDRQGRLTEVNPALAALCGGRPEDLVGRHMSEFVAPRDRDAVAAHFRARIAGERRGATDSEFWLLTLDGEERLCHLRTDSVVENGVVLGTHGVLRDVTEERRTASALRSSEARFRSLVEQSLAGIFIVDEGRLAYANPRLAEMFGYEVGELTALPSVLELVVEGDRRDVRTLTDHYAITGQRKDGTSIALDVHAATVELEGRSAVMGLALDVTERRETEARFRQIAENIRDAFWITDAEGERLIYATPAYAEMFGPGSVTGPFNRWLEAVHPDDREHARAAFVADRVHAGLYDEEYRLRTPDGSTRWIRERAYPVRDDRGIVTRITGVAEDITERKQAEETIRESETRYRLMVEGSEQVFFFSHDSEGRFLDLSESVETVLGYTPAELIGRSYHVLHEAPDEVTTLRTAAALVTGEAQPPYTTVVRRKDGTRAYLEIAEVPERQGDAVVALRGFARDVTRRKRLEEQLQQAHKMEAVGRLAGGVAHDFNNLLTSIQGHADLALEAVSADSPLHDDLEEIRRSAERATSLTRQLLAFSRKQVLRPTVLDLNAAVQGLEKMLNRLIGENITMETALYAEPASVLADAGQIEQVVVNLVVNARDAMPDGGRLVVRTSNVMLTVGDVPGVAPSVLPGIRLSVSDTGVGMSAKTQARVFDPFFTTKEQGKGTGLGLATVYGIVTQSGGTVQVESEEGRGSTFHVDLALAGQPAAPEVAPRSPQRPRGTEVVLVIEDEAGVRQLCRRVLERHGYRVLEAEDGNAALRQLAADPAGVDLVLSDIVMPGLTGRALVQAIRDVSPDVPFVFMSGYAEEAIERHGVVEDGTLFLEKPFTPDDLLQTIRGALDGRSLQAG